MSRRWRTLTQLLEKPWAAYTFALCVSVLLYLFLSNLGVFWHGLGRIYHYIAPVFIGLVIAYVLDPLVKFFETHVFNRIENRKLVKSLSVAVVFGGIILFIVILLVALVPQLISSIRMFLGNLGSYGRGLNNMLSQLNEFAAEHDVDISDITSTGTDFIGTIISTLPKNLNGILDTTISYGVDLFNLCLSCIIAVYLLLDKERLLKGANRLYKAIISKDSYYKSNSFLGRCNAILIRYILCDLLDGLMVGSINAVFMILVGYPYVPLISVIIGVTNLVPTFGPVIGGAVGATILFLIKPWYGLVFIIFTIILQTFDGYIFKPRLFGSLMGVSPIWILAAIIVFGRMFGVVGILLAIPLAAIVDFIYKDIIIVYLEKRRLRLDAAEAASENSEAASENNEAASENNEAASDNSKAAYGNSNAVSENSDAVEEEQIDGKLITDREQIKNK